MADNQPAQPTQGNKAAKTQDDLIRQVTERVWEMLREDLRREQERRGTRFSGSK